MKEPNPEKWVFIIGCFNSGTTLLSNILALHPSIGTMPFEGQVFTDELPKPLDFGIPRLWALKPESFYLDENNEKKFNVSKIKRQWAFAYNDRNKPLLLEKTVTHGARMRWLQKNFNNSYFICMVRNGYAVAEGIKRRASHPMEKCIFQWQYSNEIMLKDMEHLNHKILISYEDLTTDTENILNKIARFLEIDSFDKKILDKNFSIQNNESKIQNMNDKSIKNLTAEEVKTINSVAGETLTKFGYEILNEKNFK